MCYNFTYSKVVVEIMGQFVTEAMREVAKGMFVMNEMSLPVDNYFADMLYYIHPVGLRTNILSI